MKYAVQKRHQAQADPMRTSEFAASSYWSQSDQSQYQSQYEDRQQRQWDWPSLTQPTSHTSPDLNAIAYGRGKGEGVM